MTIRWEHRARWFPRLTWLGYTALGIALVFLWLATLIASSAVTDATCKRYGWREGQVTWRYERFCLSRVEQTDVVVPLSEAHRRSPSQERSR